MSDNSLSDQLSNLFPAQAEQQPISDAQRGLLIDSLKTFAGQAGGDAQGAINQFLTGKGELAEATRAAATGGTSALDGVVDLLASKFKISPTIAKIIVPLLLKLAPSILGQVTGTEPAKAKPRRKTSTSKKETSSGKKTAAKPKTSTANKKTSSSSKKETATSKKRKTSKNVVNVG